MKIIVRSFVVALALTGVIASTSANGSTAKIPTKIAPASMGSGMPSPGGCNPFGDTSPCTDTW